MLFGAASISLLRNIMDYSEVLLQFKRCLGFVLDHMKTYSPNTKPIFNHGQTKGNPVMF